MFSIAFIGTGFPSVSFVGDCRFLTDFRVGSCVFSVGFNFFWFILFGNGAVFSYVGNPSSPVDVFCT